MLRPAARRARRAGERPGVGGASSGGGGAAARRSDAPHADEPGRDGAGGAWNDAMDGLLALIRDELGRPDNRRLQEIEPGQWWLADRDDRTAAALPLADRVEWAIFSLLSTAGPPVGGGALRADRDDVHRVTTSPTRR